jgi:hypothetical protein
MSARPIRQDYERLRNCGFTKAEASSLIALANGLDRDERFVAAGRSAWRFEELLHLDFIRYLLQTGRLRDDVG